MSVRKALQEVEESKDNLDEEIAIFESTLPSNNDLINGECEGKIGINFQFERMMNQLNEYRKAVNQLVEKIKERIAEEGEMEEFINLSGNELAELLGVDPSTLSRSAKNDYRCKGYKVKRWVVRFDDEEDERAKEYRIPLSVYEKLTSVQNA